VIGGAARVTAPPRSFVWHASQFRKIVHHRAPDRSHAAVKNWRWKSFTLV